MAGGPDKQDQGSFDNDVWKLLQTASSNAPTSATATGYPGQIAYASGFIYVCVAKNVWQSVAIATF